MSKVERPNIVNINNKYNIDVKNTTCTSLMVCPLPSRSATALSTSAPRPPFAPQYSITMVTSSPSWVTRSQ